MKKTKIFILFMGALLVLGLSACGKKTLEDLIVGRWQDPQEGTISCFNEDGSYELNGEQIGYYSVEKNHLEIYLYDSRIPATKLYGDVELNGDDYFSGYFVLENEDGEIVEEDNEAFARLGGNTDRSYTDSSCEEDSYVEDSSSEEEGETISSGNPIRDIIVGTWWNEENEFYITFYEDGTGESDSDVDFSYSVDGSTVKIFIAGGDPEEFSFDVESFSAVHLTLANGDEKLSLDKQR